MITDIENVHTLEGLTEFVSRSLADKSIFKWAEPEDFNQIFDSISVAAGDSEKLSALACLGRIEAAVKKVVYSKEQLLSMVSGPPDLLALKDGDDRYYAVTMIQKLAPEWITEWLATQAWREVSAEKCRQLLIANLLENSENLETALANLDDAGKGYVKEANLTEAKISARFLRIIKALRAAIKNNDVSCDITIGVNVDTFISAPFAHLVSTQIEINTREKLVKEVVALLLDLTGQHFSLAIDFRHYTALKRMRRWCDEMYWRKLALEEGALIKLGDNIIEALLILGRQGITDGELITRLKECQPGEQDFLERCGQIADNQHLEPEISDWFRSGGKFQEKKKTLTTDDNRRARNEKTDIGDLLFACFEACETLEKADSAIGELEIFDPSLSVVVKTLSDRIRIIDSKVKDMADKSSIALIGKTGETIDIDRKLFELSENQQVSRRHGVVIRPAITVSEEGKLRVLKKGLVKPSEG